MHLMEDIELSMMERIAYYAVIIFIIGFILYFLTASFLCRIKGGDSSYVDAMFMWGTLSKAECLHYVKDEFRALYCGVVPVLL